MIYRNVVVDIPENAYVSADASVFIKDKNEYDPKVKYNHVHHVIVGRAFDTGRMYPNSNYRMLYPTEYAEASGENLPRQSKRIGLYTVILSISERTGLYRALYESFGIENANAIMDFAMYSISQKSCAVENFPSAMGDQLLFSNKVFDQHDFYRLFNREMTSDRIAVFKKKWAQTCQERGLEDAWIAIDGSNNNCEAENVELAEQGKAKSRKNVPVIGYMYAVDAVTGCPITFTTYRGGRVDCKELIEVIGWLSAFGVKTRGAIVDRGFATKEDLTLLDENGLPYVAMLKGDSAAHKGMVEEYGNSIRMEYSAMLNRFRSGEAMGMRQFKKADHVLYGRESGEKVKVFESYAYSTYVSLIYDSTNGLERQEALYKKVTNEARELQQKIWDEEHGIVHRGRKKKKNDGGQGDETVKTYIKIENQDGRKSVILDERKLQEAASKKGFYTLATSENMDAKTANDVYSLRNNSEEQFSIIKSQLGYDVTRSHFTEGTIARLTMAFICSVIRNELMRASLDAELATNSVINELNMITMGMNAQDRYYAIHTESKKQKEFMEKCGVIPSDLDAAAQNENDRMGSAEPNPFHSAPSHSDDAGKPERRGPGRPKGSKNRMKKEKIATETVHRKPGRPKGSKNKKTLEREAAESRTKRGPGRPKGSPNKPKVPADQMPSKRKRGRPKKEG